MDSRPLAIGAAMIVLSPQATRLLATATSFASLPAAASALSIVPLSNADWAELAAILASAGFKPRLVNFAQVLIREAKAPQALSR
jgi:hypothetical protein